MRLLVLVSATFLLTLAFACNKKTAATTATADAPASKVSKTIAFGEQDALAIGETLSVEKANVSLSFLELVEDSRCPKYVNCIRAGEAILLVSLNGSAPQRVKIDANTKKVTRLPVNGGTIELTGLTPYPESGLNIAPADRRLQLRLVAGEKM